jgi:hypothetical protein
MDAKRNFLLLSFSASLLLLGACASDDLSLDDIDSPNTSEAAAQEMETKPWTIRGKISVRKGKDPAISWNGKSFIIDKKILMPSRLVSFSQLEKFEGKYVAVTGEFIPNVPFNLTADNVEKIPDSPMKNKSGFTMADGAVKVLSIRLLNYVDANEPVK